MSGKKIASDDERIIALLGAAACRPTEPEEEPCPDEEALAAYIDNRLGGVERETMLAHLNRCPRCYHQWLEAATYLQALGADRKSPPISPRPARGRSLASWLAASWRVLVPTAAVAVLAALVVFWWPAPDLASRIDSSYASARAGAPFQVAAIAGALRLPWEEETLGFSGPAALPAQRAFGAGLWAGRAALQGGVARVAPADLAPPVQGSWQDSGWADYYQFGRWTVLLRALTQTERSAEDWRQYQDTLQVLRARLAQRKGEEEAAHAVAALDGIEPLLGRLQTAAPADAREALARRLDAAMHQLAP